jgi:hypothetical protein
MMCTTKAHFPFASNQPNSSSTATPSAPLAAAVALTTNPPAIAIGADCALQAHADHSQSAVLNGQWLCIIIHLSATRGSQPSQAVCVQFSLSN